MPTSNYHFVSGSQQHNFEAKLEPSSQAGEVWFTTEGGNKQRAFRFNNWIMGCCGAMGIERFSYDEIDWEQVKTLLSKMPETGHSPKEIYFLLTPYQTGEAYSTGKLVRRPDVKLIDVYYNTVHSNTKLSLYRWSFSKDFSK